MNEDGEPNKKGRFVEAKTKEKAPKKRPKTKNRVTVECREITESGVYT